MAGLDTEVRYVSAEGDDVSTSLGQLPVTVSCTGFRCGGSVPLLGSGTIRACSGPRPQVGHIGHESLLELDRLWLADFDPQVEWLASQPLWLSGMDYRREDPTTPDRHQRLPVAFVPLAAGTTLKGLNQQLLAFYGHPAASRVTSSRLASLAVDCVISCDTRLIVIDDVHFIDF